MLVFRCGSKKRYLTKFCSRNSGIPHMVFSVDNCMSITMITQPVVLVKDSKGFQASYNAVNGTEQISQTMCNRFQNLILFWGHMFCCKQSLFILNLNVNATNDFGVI